jgi:DNA ligase-1
MSASSEATIEEMHDSLVAQGYEGAIIRLVNGLYRFGYRSDTLLKFKRFQDEEFLVVAWGVGKGKFENVPIFRCQTADGKEFDVAPEGTEEERQEMLGNAHNIVGKLLTVRFFNWTDDGVPRFPVGTAVRYDGIGTVPIE